MEKAKEALAIERKQLNVEVVVDDYDADDGKQTYTFEDIAHVGELAGMFVVYFRNGEATGIQRGEIQRFRIYGAF